MIIQSKGLWEIEYIFRKPGEATGSHQKMHVSTARLVDAIAAVTDHFQRETGFEITGAIRSTMAMPAQVLIPNTPKHLSGEALTNQAIKAGDL
jgi:hypothetical protein